MAGVAAHFCVTMVLRAVAFPLSWIHADKFRQFFNASVQIKKKEFYEYHIEPGSNCISDRWYPDSHDSTFIEFHRGDLSHLDRLGRFVWYRSFPALSHMKAGDFPRSANSSLQR
jgi:hypothetical protein